MILEMIQGIFAGASALTLLTFAGITLGCSAVVFLISTPLFLIFSPILVPATIATTLLATGFTASGSLLSMAISVISWIIKQRTGAGGMPKIPGMSPSIVGAKKEEKEKKKKKEQGKESQKNLKNAKKNSKQAQKKDKKNDKKKDKKKDKK